MDPQVVSTLQQAGLSATFEEAVLTIPIEVDPATQKPKPLGDRLFFLKDQTPVPVTLKPVSQLFAGSKVPPSFAKGPTPEYVKFFATIEFTALDYLHAAGPERDEEFVRLYNHLRRRPDGTDANPLCSYLQAAARLYMSLRDVSQAEYEAVFNRLTRSAKGYLEDAASTNYIVMLHRQLHSHHG